MLMVWVTSGLGLCWPRDFELMVDSCVVNGVFCRSRLSCKAEIDDHKSMLKRRVRCDVSGVWGK